LANLGHIVSDQTVGNVLARHDIPPAPERRKNTTWKEFVRQHMSLLVSTDFFTTEVWCLGGLVTFYVLFFMRIRSREVHVAGMTPHPNEAWMAALGRPGLRGTSTSCARKQIARNITMADMGFLKPGDYLIHDRDKKYCNAFVGIVEDADANDVPLPPRSPNLNAHAERWIGSIKSEVLSNLILFGERSLRRSVAEFVSHYHEERNHQGKDNVLLFPSAKAQSNSGKIRCDERIGGLPKFYHRRAA